MRFLYLLLILLILPIISCSDDNPTASKPTLDTTPKAQGDRFGGIDRWDGDNWVSAERIATINTTWRFISYSGDLDNDTGGRVTGGYTVKFTNPANELLNVRIGTFRFFDELDILIDEFNVIPDDEFTIQANSSRTRNGSFNFTVANLAVTELIVRMGIGGRLSF
tara:strand:+ start:130 stop:624 length:495 start_codon:yes stop_codon:yes gene_type:complete